jgi:hypothetical protein
MSCRHFSISYFMGNSRELISERFGIRHFHHPEILQAIDNLAPEYRLLRLIDDAIPAG